MAGPQRTTTDEDIRLEVVRARDKAQDFRDDPAMTRLLVVEAMKQLDKKSALGLIYHDMNAGLRLVGAWLDGRCEAQWEVIADILAGAIYLISPLDLVPDFVPNEGLLDDAAVISTVLYPLKEEIDSFREWEQEQ